MATMRAQPEAAADKKGGPGPFALHEAVAAIPLGITIVLLPFMYGGRYAGWLQLAEATTFAAVAFLAVSKSIWSVGSWSFLGAVALAVLAATLSTLGSPAPAISVPLSLEWFWLGASALLVLQLAERPAGRQLLFFLLLVAVFAQVFRAYYIWLGSGDPTEAQVGTFYASNQYAGYVLLLAALPLAWCFQARTRLVSVAAAIAVGFLYLAVALSGSRGGVVAAGIEVLAAAAIVAQTSWRRAVGGAALLVVAVVALGLVVTSPVLFHSAAHGGPTGAQGVLNAKGGSDVSLIMRVRWAEEALRMGAHHLLIGTGLGTFGAELLRIQSAAWQWSQYAHNQYLEAFAEGGLPLGLAMIAIPVCALASGIRRPLWASVSEEPFRLGLWAGLLGGSVHLAVDHDWSYPAYAAAFVVVACLVVASSQRGEAKMRLAVPWRCCLAVLACLCLVVTAGAYLSQRLAGDRNLSRTGARLALALAPYSTSPLEKMASQEAAHGGRSGLLGAAASLRGSLRRNPGNLAVESSLAGIYSRLGDPVAAQRAYEAAIAISPGDVDAYLQAAAFEVQVSHDPVGAAALLDRGIARFRVGDDGLPTGASLVSLLASRANVALDLGNTAAATGFAREATKIGPSEAAAWLSLHSISCATGDAAAAAQAAQEASHLGAPPATPC